MGQIGAKIENLDKILRAPKGRGSMGEESLEEILRSIFPPNLWERQFPIDKSGVVDAVVKTENGIIPIDAKFPLENFEKLIHAEEEADREAAQRDFQKDMKKRINEVAKYIRPENNTLNFAILFLPNENIYYEAAIRSNDIPNYARSKKVLLTGPNTMLYVLHAYYGIALGFRRPFGWPARYCRISPQSRWFDDDFRGYHGKSTSAFEASLYRSP